MNRIDKYMKETATLIAVSTVETAEVVTGQSPMENRPVNWEDEVQREYQDVMDSSVDMALMVRNRVDLHGRLSPSEYADLERRVQKRRDIIGMVRGTSSRYTGDDVPRKEMWVKVKVEGTHHSQDGKGPLVDA
jgi:hypothetical protein